MARSATTPLPAATTTRRSTVWGRAVAGRGAYAFIAPSILLLLVFNYYPIISAFYHSAFVWDGVNATYTGLGNFKAMLSDDALLASIPNVLLLTGFRVLAALTLPLIAAEVIFNLRSERLRYMYRVLFVVPMVVPSIVIWLVWSFLYDPMDGLINKALSGVGLGHFTHAWLGEAHTALGAIMFLGFPFIAGFNLLIYLAGLDNISQEVVDSASLDGATGLRRFLHIDIPLISGQIKLIVILTMITQIQNFQEIIVLTQGGPGFSTMVPGMVMYQNAFQFSKMGYGSAIGVVLFLVILVLTAINMRFLRSAVEYEA